MSKKSKIITGLVACFVVVAVVLSTSYSESLQGFLKIKSIKSLIVKAPTVVNLEVETVGEGSTSTAMGLPGIYVTDMQAGTDVEVLRFEVTNNNSYDVSLLKVTPEFSVYAEDPFDITELRTANAWRLYDADDLTTPIAYGTVGDYGFIPFEMASGVADIMKGDTQTFVVKTDLSIDASSGDLAQLNVWLQEDSTADYTKDSSGYSTMSTYNFVWQGSTYGYIYNGGYVNSLPSYGQRLDDSYVLRRDIARILIEAKGTPIDTSCGAAFSDVPTTDPDYDYIMTWYCNDFISGYSDGTFGPDNIVNRAEAAKLFYAFYEWTLDTTGGPHFPDTDSSAWYYDYVETLYNNVGATVGYTDGTFGPSDTLLTSTLYEWLSHL
ncbi:MAG: S-layer homology domain-containing protein [Candidatus Gracilibacteria bacterium]|jgi:hypothetical protein